MRTSKHEFSLSNDALISKSIVESSFRAVKSLVQAENNIQTVKNRIKVLKMNEQTNINKINNQKGLIQKITQARNKHLQDLRKMGVTKMQRDKMTEQVRLKNQQLRDQHKNKMLEVIGQIQQQKTKEYYQTVQLREIHNQLINQNKLNQLQVKQQRRNFIVQDEQKCKENIIKFYDNKTRSIYERNMSQIIKINKSRQKKQEKLNKISEIQMQMIQKHSQSQVAYKEMKNKLDLMLGKIRHDKRKDMRQMKSSIHRSYDSQNSACQ